MGAASDTSRKSEEQEGAWRIQGSRSIQREERRHGSLRPVEEMVSVQRSRKRLQCRGSQINQISVEVSRMALQQ